MWRIRKKSQVMREKEDEGPFKVSEYIINNSFEADYL
jgi:hypothetical protein